MPDINNNHILFPDPAADAEFIEDYLDEVGAGELTIIKREIRRRLAAVEADNTLISIIFGKDTWFGPAFKSHTSPNTFIALQLAKDRVLAKDSAADNITTVNQANAELKAITVDIFNRVTSYPLYKETDMDKIIKYIGWNVLSMASSFLPHMSSDVAKQIAEQSNKKEFKDPGVTYKAFIDSIITQERRKHNGLLLQKLHDAINKEHKTPMELEEELAANATFQAAKKIQVPLQKMIEIKFNQLSEKARHSLAYALFDQLYYGLMEPYYSLAASPSDIEFYEDIRDGLIKAGVILSLDDFDAQYHEVSDYIDEIIGYKNKLNKASEIPEDEFIFINNGQTPSSNPSQKNSNLFFKSTEPLHTNIKDPEKILNENKAFKAALLIEEKIADIVKKEFPNLSGNDLETLKYIIADYIYQGKGPKTMSFSAEPEDVELYVDMRNNLISRNIIQSAIAFGRNYPEVYRFIPVAIQSIDTTANNTKTLEEAEQLHELRRATEFAANTVPMPNEPNSVWENVDTAEDKIISNRKTIDDILNVLTTTNVQSLKILSRPVGKTTELIIRKYYTKARKFEASSMANAANTSLAANMEEVSAATPEQVVTTESAAQTRKNSLQHKDVIYNESKTELIKVSNHLSKVKILDGVQSINDEAFKDCTQLTSIEIPDSVLKIGKAAFAGCTALKMITLPMNLTDINDFVFDGCQSLTAINIPDGVRSIGQSAFANCGLKEVTLAPSVDDIDKDAFANNISLKTVRILCRQPIRIGSSSFAGCPDITIECLAQSEIITYCNSKDHRIPYKIIDAEKMFDKKFGPEMHKRFIFIKVRVGALQNKKATSESFNYADFLTLTPEQLEKRLESLYRDALQEKLKD